ncbi:MAG: GNAT family N-acetyltransferase, partial [Armatimonadetes bacterium]|nr:GNAT family N-acetyltransferase [Armatimonadota bacterium]
MAYEIRWLRTDEWDQCLDLLAEVMDANRGYFSDSFKRDHERARSLVLASGSDIASHIRIFDTRRQVGDCSIRSAEIGDVCTHPRHRGRGYMTALLNVAAQMVYLEGYDISAVYSGVPIYQKAGWVAFPEPEPYLLWRLINIKSLFARTIPVFEGRVAQLAQPYEGVIAVSCNGQRALLEFTKE